MEIWLVPGPGKTILLLWDTIILPVVLMKRSLTRTNNTIFKVTTTFSLFFFHGDFNLQGKYYYLFASDKESKPQRD